jgi:putative hydrolase of the HAD superfamily
MLKAILFDIDETLLDWRGRTRSWEDYEREHLERVYFHVHETIYPLPISSDQFYENLMTHVFVLWGDAKQTLTAPHLGKLLIQTFSEQGVTPDLLIEEELLAVYDNRLVPGVKPFPDVLTELPYLKQQGLRLGIVTNALQPMSMRDIELQEAGLLDYFEDHCRLSAADVGYLKPHPRIFQEALERLRIAPQEAVFVGDNLAADIAGAQSIGMKAILRERVGALHYTISNNGTEEITPDGTIVTLRDLYPLLDGWYPDWRELGS